ncbi:hypothetical protein EVAR_65613_1 [Eumeta japonica]|uniref:G-protein coupled receptors family 1 profile domain-containing protein n=1 Tax=Eumeta variegata TaxID=151549 RepID=A0A4C1ZDT6_EUMVA|nr:hypothetical protein EVAR_65613_1 [Eumeta japonica]
MAFFFIPERNEALSILFLCVVLFSYVILLFITLARNSRAHIVTQGFGGRGGHGGAGAGAAAMWVNASEAAGAAAANVTPLVVLYVFVILFGIIGNMSLIVALSSAGGGRLRTPQLLSTCAADLLVCAASAPLAAARAATRHQPLPCPLAYYAEAFPVTASTLSLMAMAVDRFLSVRRGRGHGPAPCARPWLAVTTVWLTASVLSAAAAIAPCVPIPALAAAHALAAYCVPAAGVARCHWAVRARLTALSLTARAAHGELPLPVPLMRRPTHVIIVAGVGPRSRRDAVDGGDVRTRRAQPSLLGPQPPTSTLRARRRLGNVLVGIAGVFAACWGPHATLALMGAWGARAPPNIAHYALLLGHMHSALNAATCWVLNRHALAAACAAWRLPQLRVREERPSSTNEAALGAFHPRLARPPPSPRPAPSSFLY